MFGPVKRRGWNWKRIIKLLRSESRSTVSLILHFFACDPFTCGSLCIIDLLHAIESFHTVLTLQRSPSDLGLVHHISNDYLVHARTFFEHVERKTT